MRGFAQDGEPAGSEVIVLAEVLAPPQLADTAGDAIGALFVQHFECEYCPPAGKHGLP